MVTLDKIYHAAFILKEVARKTDLIQAPLLSHDAALYLKTENLQVTGSFKLRGAYYKISQLTEQQKAAGIIACSAGNHAQGVALAATHQGVHSVVCMPDSAPISKVEATKRLGAEVVLTKGAYDDAYEQALRLQKETGATLIHPFDDDEVIAGQGTIGLEILDQLPDVDAIIVPVGGGGLISGVAFAVKQLQPSVKIYGVQAENAPSMFESHREGHQITLGTVKTFADGIAVKHPGDTTFSMVEQYVDGIVTVSEDEIAAAILAMIEEQKLIAEGAGAVSVAAAMFTRGLVTSGRNANLLIALEDKPGQLVGVSEIIAACGANVVGVRHERSDPNMAISSCFLRVSMETRDFEQIAQIRAKLTEAGFQIVN